MGLGQEMKPSPIILPVGGRMALRHFVATNEPPPPPPSENSQSPLLIIAVMFASGA